MHSKELKPRRLFVLGFFVVILAGTALLMLPVSTGTDECLSFFDSLFMATSAVCVTGLATIDPGTGLSVFGQAVMMGLIQVGGLGITSIGVMVIMSAGGKISMGNQKLAKESLNLNSGKGLKNVIKSVAHVTVAFEFGGAVCSFITFYGDFSPEKAVWLSCFHSIAAFNNAGFDLLGDFKSLTDYHADAWLCCSTSGLIIFGGLGFFVIKELISGKTPRKWSLHTKVVITMTVALIIGGTLFLKATEGGDISWLEAYFQSVSSRTAGFASISMGNLSKAGLMVIMLLMFIGASSGSTGGGIKTSTFFILLQGIKSSATNKMEEAFHYAVPANAFHKAAVITLIAIGVILTGTYVMVIMEPGVSSIDALFEMTSAFGTVGLSTGITPDLSVGAKLLSIMVMYIGRLGPLTIASLWYFIKGERTRYPEGNISIG